MGGVILFEKLGVLKSIMGGSSKIYAGLYNGTPVQIYPATTSGIKAAYGIMYLFILLLSLLFMAIHQVVLAE